MEIKDRIIIAKDFSEMPVGRDIRESKDNGETFLIRHLFPKFLKAVSESYILEVDLSGIYGYPSSFISGAFGNLSFWLGKVYGKTNAKELINKHLSIISKDNPMKATQTLREIEQPSKNE